MANYYPLSASYYNRTNNISYYELIVIASVDGNVDNGTTFTIKGYQTTGSTTAISYFNFLKDYYTANGAFYLISPKTGARIYIKNVTNYTITYDAPSFKYFMESAFLQKDGEISDELIINGSPKYNITGEVFYNSDGGAYNFCNLGAYSSASPEELFPIITAMGLRGNREFLCNENGNYVSLYPLFISGTLVESGNIYHTLLLLGSCRLHDIVYATPPVTAHTITLTTPVHGAVTADKAEAEAGETVLITTTPDSGYQLFFGTNGTKIIDANQNEITPTLLTPTAFQFVMPDADVTVSVAFQSDNPYVPGGESSGETGPQGEFDNTSDDIPVPATPDINYSDSGLVRLFNPSAAQVISFGNYLWTGLLDFNNIIKAFANPMDSLISFHKVPISVEKGAAISVKFAGVSTTVIMPPVTKQIYDLDFGTIQFPKYYGSAFDYSPYSKAKIYLPYVGEIPINIDRLIGKTIGVEYKVDCYSGTLVAYVTIDGQVYMQQSGSCLLPIPVSMNNYQQLITGGFNLLAGSISDMPQIGAGFGSTASGAADLALSAIKPASDLMQSAFGKPETASSAMGGGIAGYLGVQYPYITITRPKQNLASSFNNMYGYPLNVTDYLQSYTGFVKVADITMSDTTATTLERDEIYRLLHSGIVIYTNTPPVYLDAGQNMTLAFEKYTGRQNGACKAITTVLETTGTFRDYQDIVNPNIRVYGDLTTVLNNSNMVCIPRLNRRYFIDKITTNTNNTFDISLHCDVLESFWDDIKGSLCIIERAEKQFNLNLNDNLFVAEQRPLFQMLKFPSGFTTTSYILALSGNNGVGS